VWCFDFFGMFDSVLLHLHVYPMREDMQLTKHLT